MCVQYITLTRRVFRESLYIFLASSPGEPEESFCKQKKAASSPSERGNVRVCLPVFLSPQTHLTARLQLFYELSSWAEEEEDAPLRRSQQAVSGPGQRIKHDSVDKTF